RLQTGYLDVAFLRQHARQRFSQQTIVRGHKHAELRLGYSPGVRPRFLSQFASDRCRRSVCSFIRRHCYVSCQTSPRACTHGGHSPELFWFPDLEPPVDRSGTCCGPPRCNCTAASLRSLLSLHRDISFAVWHLARTSPHTPFGRSAIPVPIRICDFSSILVLRPRRILVTDFHTHLSFLVLPYYHPREAFYRHGYVSPIGFLWRLSYAYQARRPSLLVWPATRKC